MKIINHQNTKIVATVGPACSSYEKLLEKGEKERKKINGKN